MTKLFVKMTDYGVIERIEDETGTPLRGVSGITFEANAGEKSVLNLKFCHASVEGIMVDEIKVSDEEKYLLIEVMKKVGVI